MKTFEIITLIPNRIGNHIHFNCPIPNNYNELKKIELNYPHGGSRIFLEKFEILPKRVTEVIKYIIPKTICSL
jgi:hypothetical protein